MGAGASTLSPIDKEVIVRSLRSDLMDVEEKPDDVILSHLETRLKALLADARPSTVAVAKGSNVTTKVTRKKDPSIIVKKRTPSHGIGFYSGIKPLPRMTRRRSFGETDVRSGLKLMQSQSSPCIENENEGTELDETQTPVGDQTTPADHWDSVSQLPFCALRAMAFKSTSLLDRHVKFSDLHTMNVKRKKQEEGIDEESTAAAAALGSERMGWDQSDGLQYKLLYVGNKFFWRSQETIDITFYHHLTASAIECVPFDPRASREFMRIYLDLHILHDYIDKDVELEVEALRVQHVAANAHDKFQSSVFDATGERQRLTRIAITNFILGRLQLRQVMVDRPQGEIPFMEGTTTGLKSPLLPGPPAILVPVKMTHRRNTSSEEVSNKMDELRADQQAIRASITKAEVVSGLVRQFVSIQGHKKSLLGRYSVPRVRWILAIRKVIQINMARAVREMLQKKGWQLTVGKKPSAATAMPGSPVQSAGRLSFSGGAVPVPLAGPGPTASPNSSADVVAGAAVVRRRKGASLYVQAREFSSPVIRSTVPRPGSIIPATQIKRQHVQEHGQQIARDEEMFYQTRCVEDESKGDDLTADVIEFLLQIARNEVTLVAEMLVQERVNVSVKNSFDRDGMQIAARNGSVSMLEVLKANGGDVTTLGPHEDSLMHLAAANGHVDAMKWLQTNGVSPDAVNILGQTAVHIAARRGEVKSLQLMDSWGCDLRATDMYGQTPYQSIPRTAALVGDEEALADCRAFIISVVGNSHSFGRKLDDLFLPELSDLPEEKI